MYGQLICIWVVILLMWIYNLLRNRAVSNNLNKAITLYPLTKIIFCVIGVLYWRTLSTQGGASDFKVYTYGCFYITSEAVFYIMLMTVGSGWGLYRRALGLDKYLILVSILALIGTRLLGFLVYGLFYLLSYIVYIVILIMIFRWVNKNIYDLEIDIRNNPAPLGDTSDEHNRQTNETKDKMAAFKIVMLAYVALVMLSALFEVLFLRDYAWISEMIRELLEVTVFMTVAYNFKLRRVINSNSLDDDVNANYPMVELQPIPPSQN